MGHTQSMGGALLENLSCYDDGTPLATTLVGYALLTVNEVPAIAYRLRPRRDIRSLTRRIQEQWVRIEPSAQFRR